MATEKILNTRIQLKYDSYANWTSNNPVLKSGELAIVYLGPTHTTTTPDNGTHPILFKVGPGNFNALPWASALAADVYAWAKKENPDWTDFPSLPIEVIDNGTGKFVTDVEYSENKITISRSDVDWSDVKNAPDFGVLSIEAADASLEISPIEGDVKAKAKLSAVEGNILRLENDGLYVPTPEEVSLPSVTDAAAALSFVTKVDQADGQIASFKAALVQGANITLTQAAAGGDITIAGKDWSSEIETALANAKKYADENDANDNTAHTHTDGIGVKVTGNGGTEGEVKIDLDVKFNESLVTKEDKKYLQLLDATDSSLISEFDVTEFVKDGMLQSVAVDEAANTITFTWNTDGGVTETTVELDKIADIYTGSTGADITINVSNENVISATLNKTFAEKSELAGYKTVQEAYSAEGSTVKTITKVEQNANGEIAVTYGEIAFPAAPDYTDEFNGKKDKQTAYAAEGSTAKTITKVEQNENGEVTVTYSDIAFPAPPTVNDGKFTVSGTGALTGSGSMSANQDGDTTATLDVAPKGITTEKIADKAIGAEQTKAYQGTIPTTPEEVTSDEVWVFYCGSSTILT